MLTQKDYARLRSLGQFDTLEAQYFALRARLEASVSKAEHNRIVADTITSIDAERTAFEEQIARLEEIVQTKQEVNDHDAKYQTELEAERDRLAWRVRELEQQVNQATDIIASLTPLSVVTEADLKWAHDFLAQAKAPPPREAGR